MSPYTLRPLKPEDIPRAIDVRAEAFRGTPASRAIRPNGFSSVMKASYIKDDVECMAKRNRYYIGVTDDATGQLVAYSSWHLYDQIEHNTPPKDDEGPLLGMNADAFHFFFGEIERSKKRVMGTKDYWYLEILSTHPDYKGKGLGKMILRWGIEQANSQGLEIFLDSTEDGKPLYDRMGFEVRESRRLDLNPYGVDHINLQWGMVRPPKPLP